MEIAKIVALCIGAAVVYGILHDQVTARVCVEYFTIGHPPIFNTHSPTLLAFGWGVLATWWVGLLLGIPVALVSRIGSWPKYTAALLARPILGLLLVMGCASLVAGVVGYFAADAAFLQLFEPMQSLVPREKHVAFLADACAHLAAYGVGFLGGLVLCIWVLILRERMARAAFRQQRNWLSNRADHEG